MYKFLIAGQTKDSKQFHFEIEAEANLEPGISVDFTALKCK